MLVDDSTSLPNAAPARAAASAVRTISLGPHGAMFLGGEIVARAAFAEDIVIALCATPAGRQGGPRVGQANQNMPCRVIFAWLFSDTWAVPDGFSRCAFRALDKPRVAVA